MESGLRLQEFSEGRGIDVAVEGGLEAHGFKPDMEEPSGVPLAAGALLAPGLLSGGPVERQMEGEVVGDGQRRALIEVGDEVRRDGRLVGIPAHGRRNGPGLALDPPSGRQAEEGDAAGVGGGRLEAEDCGQVGQRQRRACAGDRLEAETCRLRDLEFSGEAAPVLDNRGPSGAEVRGEGAGGLVGAGVGQEDRPVLPLLGSGSERPEVVGEDVGEELDGEGSALTSLALGFGLDGDGLSIHGSFRAKVLRARLSGRDRARAGWEPSRLGRRPTSEGSALTAPTSFETLATEGGPKDWWSRAALT